MPDKTNDFLAKLPIAHRALQQWYKKHGRRDLPWRNTRDPYAIYISEIMLQQTQVKTVLERYYSPFLKRFPTLAVLAKADSEAVIKQWEGLGYYSRAGNLHRAAQQSGGKLPKTVEGLIALPGIGRNTAHAVAAFAFGVAVPVMEANVKRVLCRVFALETPSDIELWEKAELLLDRKNPFDYNQAMMDIGAMVCTKRNPACVLCPLSSICKGKASPQAYPVVKAVKQVPVRKRTIIVFDDGKGRYFLERRKTRFLKGLYGFMEYDLGIKTVMFMEKPYALKSEYKLGHVSQTYSHFTLDAEVYKIILTPREAARNPVEYTKANLKEIKELPLSRADLKIVALLEDV